MDDGRRTPYKNVGAGTDNIFDPTKMYWQALTIHY